MPFCVWLRWRHLHVHLLSRGRRKCLARLPSGEAWPFHARRWSTPESGRRESCFGESFPGFLLFNEVIIPPGGKVPYPVGTTAADSFRCPAGREPFQDAIESRRSHTRKGSGSKAWTTYWLTTGSRNGKRFRRFCSPARSSFGCWCRTRYSRWGYIRRARALERAPG